MDLFEKYRKYIIVALVLVIIFGIYLIYTEPKEAAKDEEEIITVDISGAVRKPGIYTFKAGDRVIDAINRAGGLTQKADLDMIAQDINQASKLEDEQKILIPAKQKTIVSPQVAPAQTGDHQNNQTSQTTVTGKINLNQASASQLESLPGVGPVYAQRIIELRTKLGRFSSPGQLLEVSGIGERTLEKILPHISL